jgi:hypothetical protein
VNASRRTAAHGGEIMEPGVTAVRLVKSNRVTPFEPGSSQLANCRSGYSF